MLTHKISVLYWYIMLQSTEIYQDVCMETYGNKLTNQISIIVSNEVIPYLWVSSGMIFFLWYIPSNKMYLRKFPERYHLEHVLREKFDSKSSLRRTDHKIATINAPPSVWAGNYNSFPLKMQQVIQFSTFFYKNWTSA